MKKRFEKAVVSDIPAATEFLEEALEALGCPQKTVFQMDTVLDEIFCNVVQYAYPEGQPGPVELTAEAGEDGRTFVLTIEDAGRPFNPLKQKAPDITASAEERTPGGLGIYIVRKLTDEVAYAYKDGKNILRITKRY